MSPLVGPTGAQPSWEIGTREPCVLTIPRAPNGETVLASFSCATAMTLERYDTERTVTDAGFGQGAVSLSL